MTHRTAEVFRDDAYIRACEANVLDVNERHRVVNLLANLAVARKDFYSGAFELVLIWRRSPSELSRPKLPDRAQQRVAGSQWQVGVSIDDVLLDTPAELAFEFMKCGIEAEGAEDDPRQVFFAERARQLLAVDPRRTHDLEDGMRVTVARKVLSQTDWIT